MAENYLNTAIYHLNSSRAHLESSPIKAQAFALVSIAQSLEKLVELFEEAQWIRNM